MRCIHRISFCNKYKESYNQLYSKISTDRGYYHKACDPYDNDESSTIPPEFYTYDDGESEGFLRNDDDPFDYDPD